MGLTLNQFLAEFSFRPPSAPPDDLYIQTVCHVSKREIQVSPYYRCDGTSCTGCCGWTSASRHAARHGSAAGLLYRRGPGGLWQNRFYSCALDAQHTSVALRYVERNPVRAGLVDLVGSYRWSSASAHLDGSDPRGLLDMSFWEEQGGRECWHTLLASPEELLEIRMLQRGTFTGRPVGSDQFLERLEQQTHRQLRPHQGVCSLRATG